MISGKLLNVNQVFNAIEREISRLGTRIAVNALKELKKVTPVKTGRAKRNWRLKRGANPSVASTTVEKTTIVSNRTPYIGLLERGRSKQAPRGMMGPAQAGLRRRKYIK